MVQLQAMLRKGDQVLELPVLRPGSGGSVMTEETDGDRMITFLCAADHADVYVTRNVESAEEALAVLADPEAIKPVARLTPGEEWRYPVHLPSMKNENIDLVLRLGVEDGKARLVA